MSFNRVRSRSLFAALVVCLALPVPIRAQTGADDGAPRLTIERLYSLPTLIGTAPEGFMWAPDGNRLELPRHLGARCAGP